MNITIIVAASQNNVIGKDNQLPWHLPRDLAYFKAITTGCPVIMGRKTYESIGFALPNRFNIVITHNHDYTLPDADVVNGLPEAIEQAKSQQPDTKAIHIIGGATIFKAALPLIDTIYLNRVLADIDGDTYLPDIDWKTWQLASHIKHPADEKNAHSLRFEVYKKIN